MSQPLISDNELHAYLDGQLSTSRLTEVEQYLLAHPDEARRVDAYKLQNEALRSYFAPVLDEAVPEKLRLLAESPSLAVNATKPSIFARWSLQRLAAGIVIALLGGAAGWLGHGQYQGSERLAQMNALPRQAAMAHAVFSPDVRRPVEVSAEHEDQLVAWLSKRLGTPVRPPRLAPLGYELVGGRLLPGNSGPVAQFMYQDASGQRLTLYLSSEQTTNRDTGFRFAREGQINVFYWIDGPFAYALSGSIAKSDLAHVATAVYDQLEHK